MGSSAGPSEAELLRSLSPAYVDRLVRDCGPWMLALARRILGDEFEAEDAVQEAFVCAFRGAPRFDGQSLVTTWLHRITINSALMRLRTRRRRASHDDRIVDGRYGAIRALEVHDRDDTGTHRTMRVVRAAVESLPEPYRLPILLRDIEGVEMEEVASLIELRVSGVKTRLHRGRMMLREKLLPLLEEDEPTESFGPESRKRNSQP
jgi:RNA polymerase sigma-70 factor, ECF subfamily